MTTPPPLDAKDFADYLRQHAASQRPHVRAELERIADGTEALRRALDDVMRLVPDGNRATVIWDRARHALGADDAGTVAGPFDTAEQLIAALDAPEPVRERGPWTVYIKDGRAIGVLSDDFQHDALLRVSGDFADDARRLEYCELIAALLNEAIAARNARATADAPAAPPPPDTSQEWAKLDGATAFLLIDRHAEDWSDTDRMMDAWRTARAADLPHEVLGWIEHDLHMAGCNCAKPLLGWKIGGGPRCRLCNVRAYAKAGG